MGKCGCGRSPTGLCVGWHKLTEEEYKEKKNKYGIEKYNMGKRMISEKLELMKIE